MHEHAESVDSLTANQTSKVTGDSPATANLRMWQKGQTGNPTGRPKGQVHMIKMMTNHGEDMIKFWVATMENPQARLRDRLAASVELANRLWGKPRETLEVVGEGQQLRIRLSWQDASGQIGAGETLEGAVRVLPSADESTTLEGQGLPAGDQPAEVAD